MAEKRSIHSKAPPSLERVAGSPRVRPPDIACKSAHEIHNLTNQLKLHQIKLALQNEELARTQADLMESRDRFNHLYDFATVGYFTLNSAGIVLEANLTLASMLGTERRNLVGCKFTSFVPPYAQDALYLYRLAVLSSDEKQTCDIDIRRANGTTFTAQLEAGSSYDTASGDCRQLCLISDITTRKQVEAALTQSHTELELRVDLRTRELQQSVELLKASAAQRETLESEILDVSERERLRLGMDLHDDLSQQLTGLHLFATLHFNKLKSESHPEAELAADLKDYVYKAMNTARNLSKSFFPVELEQGGLILALGALVQRTEELSQIRCQLHADEGFWIEKGRAIHLYRIVQESIGNTLKHGKASLIIIECRRKQGMCTVLISDDGIGMESSLAINQAKVPPANPGIGLHLFQYRARLMGATLVLQTPSSGQGCQVSCSFPFGKPPRPWKKSFTRHD